MTDPILCVWFAIESCVLNVYVLIGRVKIFVPDCRCLPCDIRGDRDGFEICSRFCLS